MELLALLCSFFAPDLSKLGADSYAVREWESARCDNFLSAVLAPAGDPDPEVNHRLRAMRARNLRSLSPWLIECVTYREDYGLWLDRYFCAGRNRISDEDAYADLCATWDKVTALAERWPIPQLNGGWPIPFQYAVSPVEFRDLCDFHRLRAPDPREVFFPER